jgi:hypothetical protein
MAWGRLDDKANGNAKLQALGNAAWRMWGCALIFCQDNLTDGFVPEYAIEGFCVRFTQKEKKSDVINELCSVRVPGKQSLWHRVDGGYRIHDYLDWNDPRDVVLAEREKAKKRMQRLRGGKRSGERSAEHNGEHDTEQSGERQVECSPERSGSRSGVHVPLPQDATAEERGSVAAPPAPDRRKPHPIRDFLTLHEALFLELTGSKPAKYTGREAKIAERTIHQFGESGAADLLREFMASKDEFIAQAGFGLNVFEGQINKLIARRRNKPAAATRGPWMCPHVDECSNPGACANATLLGRPRKVPVAS